MVGEPPLCLINSSNPDLETLKESLLNNTVNAAGGFVNMMLYTPQGKAQYGRQSLGESLKFPPKECLYHVSTGWRDVIHYCPSPLVAAIKNSRVMVSGSQWTHAQSPAPSLNCLKRLI